jgi:hypothetical protein
MRRARPRLETPASLLQETVLEKRSSLLRVDDDPLFTVDCNFA